MHRTDEPNDPDIRSFGGDHAKCDQLNELLCQKAGFDECYDVSLHISSLLVKHHLISC